ncbi:hypothetical protein OO015_09705 [Thermomicrobium sp. 4228-Ro]|uniref:hypothetical protein n=1 Tax=Thermomicrobium sp. 4228-Ro TaxID=2993937 RepID=UPI00224943A9|nr:hypothetical protein [Thermomicrobium sp. 4228-Ro]MCX2727760.1 hypothetical protein [Thermomicrobium sp. 4228-Ro]
MTRYRVIAALLLAALALQLAAAHVAGDAGITERLPATRIADPTATPTTARFPPQPSPTGKTEDEAPASVTSPAGAQLPQGDSGAQSPGGKTPADDEGSDTPSDQQHDAPPPATPTLQPSPTADRVTGPSGVPAETDASSASPAPAGQTSDEAGSSTREIARDQVTTQFTQVAPHTGANRLATALPLLSLGVFGMALLLLGLRLSQPGRPTQRSSSR